jgi:hypothetical protein
VLLSNRVLVWFGLISFPLYLWHWPLLSFARIVENETPARHIRIAAVVISIVLAWLTYKFIEKPIRFGNYASIKTTTMFLLMLIVGFVGYCTFKADGFAFRLNGHNDLFEQLKWSGTDNATTDCIDLDGFKEMGYCRVSGKYPSQVLLIGDSHANSFFPGIAFAYEKIGVGVINLGGPGCLPFFDTSSSIGGSTDFDICTNNINYALEFGLRLGSVKTIILSMYAVRDIHGDRLWDPDGKPKTIKYGVGENLSMADIFAASFRNTLKRLTLSKKRIIVVIDWPELEFEPKDCFDIRPVRIQSKVRINCSVKRDLITKRNEAYRILVKQLQAEFQQVEWFDPLPYLCDNSKCTATPTGRLAYRDQHHLSKFGSIYLGEHFANNLLTLK